MAAIQYKALVEEYRKAGVAAAGRNLREAFEKKEVKASDFDLGRLFEEIFGSSDFQACRRRDQLANDIFTRSLQEADGAVSTTSFQNISGQIVYSAILEAYESEEFVFSKLIPEEMISNGTLDGEKIAGITEIGDEVAVRNEGDPYALAGVGENWIFAPAVKDRGMIVPVTWEAIFADRTGRLLQRCGDVGKWAGQNKEKRAVDCMVDENVTAHRYSWLNRGAIATYGDNSGTHSWDNLAASNALVDWTNINAAEQVFNGLVDPFTGEPIVIDAKHLIVTKQLEQTARRIISATEITLHASGYATTGDLSATRWNNPYLNKFELVTSRLLAARMATDTSWFIGDVSKLARYRVAERLNVQQAPANSDMEFERRIVQRFRVNERGAFYTVEPRAVVKNTA